MNKKAKPPIPTIFPVSRSTWLAGVKSGKKSESVKLSSRCVAWKVDDIKMFLHQAGGKEV